MFVYVLPKSLAKKGGLLTAERSEDMVPDAWTWEVYKYDATTEIGMYGRVLIQSEKDRFTPPPPFPGLTWAGSGPIQPWLGPDL